MPTVVASAIAPQLPQVMDISPKASYPIPTSAERRKSSEFQRSPPDGKKTSPHSRTGHLPVGHPPKIVVKKEPTSPEQQSAKRRPQQLNLVNSTGTPAGRPSGPLTKDSAALGLHDVGIACLSPGFQTDDPSMQEQLQRSMSVREQQRLLIESRLHKTAKSTADSTAAEFSGGLKTPMTGKKRPPPPGLSIVPPSHEQFAHERGIQSAPLHQTFTGRHQPHPLARTVNDPHPLAAPQTHHRLPPITDVLNHDGFAAHRDRPMPFHSSSASNIPQNIHRPMPSPGLPPLRSEPQPARPREYRSAEEAIAEMTAGREEHQPRIVHYGGHQPPTPPSPPTGHALTPHKQRHPQAHHPEPHRSTSGGGRVRPRAEYERDNGSPPLGSGPSPRRVFGERDSPATNRAKKEEFMQLCARAWDLFHS